MKCPGRKESPTCLPGAEWKPSQDGEQAEGSGPGSGPRGRSERLLVPEGTGEDFLFGLGVLELIRLPLGSGCEN